MRIITDFEEAKKALISDSRNWDLLDETLKQDKKLALYYQPEGYLYVTESIDCGSIDEHILGEIYPEGFKGRSYKFIYPEEFEDDEEFLDIYREVQENMEKIDGELYIFEDYGDAKCNCTGCIAFSPYTKYRSNFEEFGISSLADELEKKYGDSLICEENYWFEVSTTKFVKTNLEKIINDVLKARKQKKMEFVKPINQ